MAGNWLTWRVLVAYYHDGTKAQFMVRCVDAEDGERRLRSAHRLGHVSQARRGLSEIYERYPDEYREYEAVIVKDIERHAYIPPGEPSYRPLDIIPMFDYPSI